jgi:hypothetical protein
MARRELTFETLDQAVADAEMLLTTGYEKTGKWDLSQVCQHMTDWLSYPIDGFPKPPIPIAAMLWVIKKTVGRKKLESYLATQSFPAGKPTMPQTVHSTTNDADAVAKLKIAALRFDKHGGPIAPSPLFGEMTKDEAVRLQLVHLAHHLSFLVLK